MVDREVYRTGGLSERGHTRPGGRSLPWGSSKRITARAESLSTLTIAPGRQRTGYSTRSSRNTCRRFSSEIALMISVTRFSISFRSEISPSKRKSSGSSTSRAPAIFASTLNEGFCCPRSTCPSPGILQFAYLRLYLLPLHFDLVFPKPSLLDHGSYIFAAIDPARVHL